jgi:NADPH2:quinone reductase
MKAIVIQAGGPALADVAQPVPQAREVLVRVHACALNRADLGMAAGHMHGARGGAGTVLGMEFAGVVSAVGAQVTHVKPGDRVMGSGAGAFAEYAVADRGRVMPIPAASMSFEQAATLPVALQTMHDAVISHGQLKAGGSVLIQGASSGVGLMAMKIARLQGASLVIGTSTDAGRRAKLTEHGAHLALDPTDPAWVDAVLAATDGKGVDLIVDQVSGPLATANLRATRILGRIVNVGRLAGRFAEFDFDLHALKRIKYTGVTFRTRSVDEVREITRLAMADLAGHLKSGKLALPIDSSYSFDKLADAFARMRANQHFGKIVVTM